MSAARLALFALALGSLSRGSLCRRDPPPVLFPGADSAATAPSVESTASAYDAGEDAGELVRSNAVPGDGSALTLDGLTVRAPAGERFGRYLALDGDADGDRDVLVTRTRVGGPAGASYFRRESAAFVPVEAIARDATASEVRCAEADLWSSSPRSAIVRYRCPEYAAGAAPGEGNEPRAQEFLLLALGATPSVRTRVDAFAAPRETLLSFDVRGLDRDGDGRDDVAITLGARAAGEREEQAATATVVWLDREGGFARDMAEPEASFARLASSVRTLATRRRAPDAALAADRVVRLRRALCGEAGAPRFRVAGSQGVSCVSSPGLRAVAEALARARLAQGELPAVAALLHDDSGSELGAVDGAHLGTEWRRAIAPDATVLARPGPVLAFSLSGVAFPRTGALQLSPAATPQRIVFHGPLTGATLDIAGLAPTSVTLGGSAGTHLELATRAPDGSRAVQGFYESCDGPFIAFCPNDASDCIDSSRTDLPPSNARRVALPALLRADTWVRCTRDTTHIVRAPASAGFRAVGYGRAGLVVSIRGVLYRVEPAGDRVVPLGTEPLGGPFPPGSSASESGAFAAVAAHEGVFVRDPGGHWKLWAPASLGSRARELTDLTIGDDGRTVAGLLGSQPWVLSPPVATPTAAPAPTAGFTPLPPSAAR